MLPNSRILKVLGIAKGPLSRRVISENASVDLAWLGDTLGQVNPEVRKVREAKKGYRSLLTLGYAKMTTPDSEGKEKRVYEITEAGRKVLASLPDQSPKQDEANFHPEQVKRRARKTHDASLQDIIAAGLPLAPLATLQEIQREVAGGETSSARHG